MLTREDHALLAEILKLGLELEAAWARVAPSPEAKLPVELHSKLFVLTSLIRQTDLASSSDLKRLAKWADHMNSDMTARHFSGVLVPFERLSQRTLRDDQIMIGDIPDATSRTYEKLTLVPVLENIRSAFNVGAVFRTAECWGLEKVVLTGYTPDPGDEKTSKTAMGTDAEVSWSRQTTTASAISDLKQNGYSIIALETIPTANSILDFEFPERSALLLGNERFGLDPESIAASDHLLRIPLRGKKNSLNVGIAFGIAAYEYSRQAEARNGI